jgi:Ser/Thr protein kinase RdoA (MazF antagonist)
LKDTAIRDIVLKFKVAGELVTAVPFGSGHINDTFRITTSEGKDYLLQRVNNFVFKDVAGLMANLVNVTGHLKKKLINIPGADPDKQVLTLVETRDNGYYIVDESGKYWRIFNFLNNTKSYDQVLTENQAYEGGKAFGRFQYLLADLDTALVVDTIPNFHNIEYRLSNLDKAIAADTANRLSDVQPEIGFANIRRGAMGRILELGKAGVIPKRIIHNDTKFNNVLLDEHDHAQCVIDLDTVMPGYVAYDFGDAIRTIINTAAEDEADPDLINLNAPLFAAYTKGYLQQATGFLTDDEVSSLIHGVMLFPYMQGVRFLTDYLDGDTYYKIHAPEHNLVRTRAQFELVTKMEKAKKELNDIILKARNDENS